LLSSCGRAVPDCTASGAALLVGTALAGAGFGTAMLGAFGTISAQAAPGQRASLIAAYFIASFTAFSIPVVAAGVAITHFGLHRTALAYCAAIAVLAAVAAGSLIFRSHRRRVTGPHHRARRHHTAGQGHSAGRDRAGHRVPRLARSRLRDRRGHRRRRRQERDLSRTVRPARFE
jgi:MFS family permease